VNLKSEEVRKMIVLNQGKNVKVVAAMEVCCVGKPVNPK